MGLGFWGLGCRVLGGLVFGLWGLGKCFLADVHAGFRGFVRLLGLANGFLKGM